MDALVSYVEEFKKKNPSGWRRIVFGVLAACALLLVVAAYLIQATARGRQLASLKHQRDVADAEAIKAAVDATVAEHEESRDLAVATALAKRKVADELKERVESLEAEHAKNAALISSLSSWEDVDAKVR